MAIFTMKYTKPRMHQLPDERTIMAGIFPLDEKDLEKWSKTMPAFQALLDDGDIIPVLEGGKPVLWDKLDKLPLAQAVKLVKDTVKMSTLLEWEKLDRRVEVVRALEDQMKAVGPTDPTNKADDEG